MESTNTTDMCQYLKFKLDQEIYALEIEKVREVMEFSEVTKVPRMPEFIRGVINLRGDVVPVVDLRLKFGMTKTEKTTDTCIIIIEYSIDDVTTLLGALTDAVQEVINIGRDQIIPPPKVGDRLDTAFLKGMGRNNDELILIVDIDRIFSFNKASMLRHPQEDVVLNEEEDHGMNEDVEEGFDK